MKRLKSVFSIIAVAALLVCVLAGCGGVVSTKMTVDKNFAGERSIDITIDAADLTDYVTGGADALKSVADANLPEQMTCALVKNEDGSAVLTFVMKFTGLEDYRTKVAAVIAKGSNKELTPTVVYENMGTAFKNGIKLEENFTSADLLQWYFDALVASGIITHETTSEWYEMGSSTFILDGTEYNAGSTMTVDEQEYTCLAEVNVITTVNMDGTFERVFQFQAYENTVEELAAKGTDLSVYLKGLTPTGDTYEEDLESSPRTYTITVTAADAAQLVEKTNAILQTENTFALTLQPDAEDPGVANITLTEKIDGSYYLRYDDVISQIYLYANTELAEENEASISGSNGGFSYNPTATEEKTFHFDWKVSFASVEIISEITDENNVKVSLVFTTEESLPAEVNAIAVDALKSAAEGHGELTTDGASSTISFSGAKDEVVSKINAFVAANDPDGDEDSTYFSLDFAEAETASRFTDAVSGTIEFDLSPIIGNTSVTFNDNKVGMSDYYYQGSFSTDEAGNRIVPSDGYVSFTIVTVSVLSIVLVCVFGVLLLAGIVLLVLNIKNIGALIQLLKEKAAEKKAAKAAAAAAAAAASPVPAMTYEAAGGYAPVQPPVQPEAQPVEQTAQPAEAVEEEEELL